MVKVKMSIFMVTLEDDATINVFVSHWRPEQNGQHFPNNILKCIFFNEIIWLLIKISLKFVPEDPVGYNESALFLVNGWAPNM